MEVLPGAIVIMEDADAARLELLLVYVGDFYYFRV